MLEQEDGTLEDDGRFLVSIEVFSRGKVVCRSLRMVQTLLAIHVTCISGRVSGYECIAMIIEW